MAQLKPSPTTQDLQVLRMVIDMKDDFYLLPSGVKVPMGKKTPGDDGLPLFQLPAGSQIVGGAVLTTDAITASGGGTKTGLRIFDKASNTNIFNTDNIESAGARPISASTLVTTGQPLMLSVLADNDARVVSKGTVVVLLHIINVKAAYEVVA